MSFAQFRSPDELGCALNSSNVSRLRKAQEAMQSIFHVRNPMVDYFGGSLRNIKQCRRSILFVGRSEHSGEDHPKLLDTLRLQNAFHEHLLPGQEGPKQCNTKRRHE